MLTPGRLNLLKKSKNLLILSFSIVIVASFAVAGFVFIHATTSENQAEAQTVERCFSEGPTNPENSARGFCISGQIRNYWESNGALPVFGYPISEETVETVEGRTITVQKFERDRIEIQNDDTITVGRLGALYYEITGNNLHCDVKNTEDWTEANHVRVDSNGNNIGGATRLDGNSSCVLVEVGNTNNNGIINGEPKPGKRYHNLCEPFLSKYIENGGVQRFGFPITEKYSYGVHSEDGGKFVPVQYFERRRMEHHTYLDGSPVLYGLLGKLIYDQEYGPAYNESHVKNAEADITGNSNCS